ncbi:hypothetical protein ASD65_03170 [Microbacterium sp. Root61]|uniref:heavy-metal-associated domain-containing protein n=1 Tax=Microbacterium sp. Root61 TaxID=1736570 RepID=UPI0007008474|nr:heavy-metal-associated domain-containing protein [Microbacterium sp. Root61]KRA23533.1 hypothetical protein ASD65_03170 [Microbacterium sp. Root61]
MTELDRIDLGLKDTTGGSCCTTTSDSAEGASCCAPTSTVTAAEASVGAVNAEFLVEGMTCSHCVASVTEELTAIDSVSDVSVDLVVGGASRVTVQSAAPVDVDLVRAAVEEAGYALAGDPA